MTNRFATAIIRSLTSGLIVSSIFSFPSQAQQAPANDRVVFLKQGWSEDDRLRYYYTSQGTAVLPYDIFLDLEEAGSADLLRSDRVAESVGMIPSRLTRRSTRTVCPSASRGP